MPLLVLAIALLAGTPAGAELFRCVGPDGSVRFTNDAHACPGARKHEPAGQVQRFDSPSPARRGAAAPAARAAAAPDTGQRAAWRQKLERARSERDRLEGEVEQMRRAVTHCNRGGTVLYKNDAGLNREADCDQVRARHASQSARLEQLRQYVAEGIHEECRRAGCLPGWLR